MKKIYYSIIFLFALIIFMLLLSLVSAQEHYYELNLTYDENSSTFKLLSVVVKPMIDLHTIITTGNQFKAKTLSKSNKTIETIFFNVYNLYMLEGPLQGPGSGELLTYKPPHIIIRIPYNESVSSIAISDILDDNLLVIDVSEFMTADKPNGRCNPSIDGICDPDCRQEEDTDCTLKKEYSTDSEQQQSTKPDESIKQKTGTNYLLIIITNLLLIVVIISIFMLMGKKEKK